MADFSEPTSLSFGKLDVDSTSSSLLFQDRFIWDWYIRLKIQPPVNGSADLSSTFEDISREFNVLWEGLKLLLGQTEGQICPETLIDSSKAYFWLIGIPTLPLPELSKSRQLLREWQKETSQKVKGRLRSFEAKFIPREVFQEHGFEVYVPMKAETSALKSATPDDSLPVKNKKEKRIEVVQAAENFKKIKGSNPQEVRRQFLEHSMRAAGSSSRNSSTSQSGKLRPGREVLNRMKFDSKYSTADFVVGYIDRKAGILEKGMDEWGNFDQEELMAYIKNVKDDEIVWDKARRIDLVFGKKSG